MSPRSVLYYLLGIGLLSAAMVSSAQASSPALRSANVAVLDTRTGDLLYSKNSNASVPIASVTKLMTALVILDAKPNMRESFQISDADIDKIKRSRSRLPVGTQLTLGEMLHLALIASENRAASALSRHYPGGRAACVAAMNRKAQALGMLSSRFLDPTGLREGNQASARDLALMVAAAGKYGEIRRITQTGNYSIRLAQSGRTVHFRNTNPLTRNRAWHIEVSKTGFTNEAGHCLVMETEVAHRQVVMVLLDSQGRTTRVQDAQRLRTWLEHGRGHRARARARA